MAEARVRVESPAYQAYQLLHVILTVIPLAAGLDKFVHLLVNWDRYVSPLFARLSPLPVHTLMLGVGGVEVIAGLNVAFVPRVGGWIVAIWLWAIIVNLLSIPGYLDIAVRDLGLSLGAVALAPLSVEYA